MITLRKKDEVLFKNFSFLFILFPFISHIYSAVFPMIYDFEISRISLVIIFSSLIISLLDKSQSWHKITWNKDLNYFLPFLVVSYASSMHNFDLYVTKYLAYIFIYFYCIRKYFLHDHIFKLYVHILVISFYLLLVIYCLNLYFDLYTPFRVENLDGLSSNSPMQTENHRAQIFYLLVFDRSDYSGILNIPRFFGFSREPGFYVMFTIPGLLIASFFKMKFQAISLAFATFIASSFAGFFVLLILVFIFILPKSQYKKIIFLLLGMLMLIILLRGFYSNLNIARVDDYVYLIDRTIFRYTSSLTSFGGMLFLLPKLTYLLIIYHYYRKTMIINLKIALMFFIAIIILLNKATELISPLFLFYLSFIDFLHKSRTCLESSESRKTN